MRYQRYSKPKRHPVMAAILTAVLVFSMLLSMPEAGIDNSSEAKNSDTIRLSESIIDAGKTLTVTIRAAQGVLPDGMTVKVRTVKKNSQDGVAIANQLKEHTKEKDQVLTGFLAYDLSFWHDGKEIEPDGEVSVTMKWSDGRIPGTESKTSDRVSVIHLEKRRMRRYKMPKQWN